MNFIGLAVILVFRVLLSVERKMQQWGSLGRAVPMASVPLIPILLLL